jgi:acid stress chaperone HdeB
MMRLLLALVLASSWVSAAPAQRFDLDLISCRELLSTDRQNMTYLIVWLRGFWTEADEAMILDLERLQADADKLTEFCARNPDVKAFEATKRVFVN